MDDRGRAAWRWMLIVVTALAVVGLIAFARGRPHHRGDQVGAWLTGSAVSVVLTGPDRSDG